MRRMGASHSQILFILFILSEITVQMAEALPRGLWYVVCFLASVPEFHNVKGTPYG